MTTMCAVPPVTSSTYDVVVVGAGPAGSMAARAAAKKGARTLIIDRATFPRYKTCGGGLIGVTLDHLPAELDVPVRHRITAASFSLRGAGERWREAGGPFLALTDRTDLDAALLACAQQAGAASLLGTAVTDITSRDDHVELTTGDGPITARYVVGADGSTSRIARHVGATMRRVDLGLEVELAAPAERRWQGRIHLDWGPMPGSYGWIFPKGDTLTVGVIHRKGEPQQTRAYLDALLRRHGLDRLPVFRSSGHLTRCRAAGSPLSSDRVLLAGDAAGLLEPWTREGISYAVRSGTEAGSLAADAALHGRTPFELGQAYLWALSPLLAEIAAGRRSLGAYERRPALFHHAITRTDAGWRAFTDITGGRLTLADALERPVVALAARTMRML